MSLLRVLIPLKQGIPFNSNQQDKLKLLKVLIPLKQGIPFNANDWNGRARVVGLNPFKAGHSFQLKKDKLHGKPLFSLNPFKAGHSFQQASMFQSHSHAAVLIPLKQGIPFNRDGCWVVLQLFVLIPLKQGIPFNIVR